MNLRANLEMMRRSGLQEQADRAEADWKARGLLGDAQLVDASEGDKSGVLSAPGAFSTLFALTREPGEGPVENLPFPADKPGGPQDMRVLQKLGLEPNGPIHGLSFSRSEALETLRKIGLDPRPYLLNLASMHYANRVMPEGNGLDFDLDPSRQAAEALANDFDLEGLLTAGGREVLLGRGGGGGGGGGGRGGGGGMRGSFPGGGVRTPWTRGRLSPLEWGDASGWWGGPWDGFCQDCYGPYCLCGADDSTSCATCGSAWKGGSRGALAGAAAAAYAQSLFEHRAASGEPSALGGRVSEADDEAALEGLVRGVAGVGRRALLVASALAKRAPCALESGRAGETRAALAGALEASDLAPLGDIFGADANQVKRIAELHARLKLHKTTTLDVAKAKVGDDPDFQAYMARWAAYVTEMNDLGERAKSTLSWITDQEIENAETQMSTFLTEWEIVRLKISGKRQEKLISVLEESKARVEAKTGAPLPPPTADQAKRSAADPDYKKARDWAAGTDLPKAQSTPYEAERVARRKYENKREEDSKKREEELVGYAKVALYGVLAAAGLYVIATALSTVGTVAKAATSSVAGAEEPPHADALALEVVLVAMSRQEHESLGDALRRRVAELGVVTSPSAGGILARAVRAGTQGPIVWTDIPGPDGLTITVGKEMLRASVDDALLRLPTSWDETPGIARDLSAQIGEDIIVPSKRIADAIYAAAPVKTAYKSMVVRTPSGATVGISTVEDAKRYNAFIDAQVKGSADLQSGAEKLWILHERLDPKANAEFLSRTGLPDPGEPRAMNYGAWDANGRVQQSVGGAHNKGHFDVTQGFRPLKRWARGKNGEKVDLLDWIEKNERVLPKYTGLFKSDAGSYS